MPAGKILVEVCHKCYPWPIYIASLLLVIAQGSLLNFGYLVPHFQGDWFWWFVADMGITAGFIVTFHAAHKFHKRTKNVAPGQEPKPEGRLEGGEWQGLLPLGYLAWLLYSGFLVARLVIIFKNIAGNLTEDVFFGPNFLKLVMAFTGPIFLLIVMSQHNAQLETRKRYYIQTLTVIVPFDIWDSIDFLEILFLYNHRSPMALNIPDSLQNIILAFSMINLILPFFCIVVLSKSYYGHRRHVLSKGWRINYVFLHILLLDGAFAVLRFILWAQYKVDISIFLIKNIVMIGVEVINVCELQQEPEDRDFDDVDAGNMDMVEVVMERDNAYINGGMENGNHGNGNQGNRDNSVTAL
ncbi:uncharacterized protein LOC106152806 [Lingula anatina]|uniref:Uncharacterized protein LOC106152806 n=1 Tax=Lingula anatina TaxID=7574 RepID=A0A1S3H7M0_LINAN|nr:uncharacterized protein LOC106152806 [Lingula anatina]|eukprot:XP_013382003.1 uncharacterized protein LOC106152806 [Lingula anatina]